MYVTTENTCKHYKRSCMLIAECCKKTYPCRFCHDENESHKIDRNSTKEIICLYCGTIQGISNLCKKCNNTFAEYFCDKCKLWTTPDEGVFHCDMCGICRVGLPDQVFHCDVCNACMDINLKENHVHIENNLKSDCPICAEYLFLSIREVLLLKCGHAMHMDCFDYYLKQNYQCPICQKSAGDTEIYNQKIEFILSHESKLQKNSKNWLCEISCYDCRKSSYTDYKYLFNKCHLCSSYNTRLGEIKKPKAEER
ncbi:hypothetical protein EDEG_02050 [Edhazardia aedis USNM 41457]|uniref:CHY-type domain-containing protein n=1 Tax=Edhazardia aedis (strain USNM 41457) TaxID=1003232 RepID=J9D7Z1_EDHAE|nr:hypothetical protein EDEG_02050 [Edhazardia aedis USNM 41457]|eukprot:EJW03619.1 hypothetical protein EDEG_02050 [Edhazardia aedis USNM 41457]